MFYLSIFIILTTYSQASHQLQKNPIWIQITEGTESASKISHCKKNTLANIMLHTSNNDVATLKRYENNHMEGISKKMYQKQNSHIHIPNPSMEHRIWARQQSAGPQNKTTITLNNKITSNRRIIKHKQCKHILYGTHMQLATSNLRCSLIEHN